MSDLSNMNYKITADFSNLVKEAERGGQALDKFVAKTAPMKASGENLAKSFDRIAQGTSALKSSVESTAQPIQRLSANTTSIATSAAKTADGLKKVAPAANTAGQSLTNLGRIAQDAPFGFIGIQNNINPLLESFQRLQAESKATGTSLTSNLVAALKGGAGLGLAVSLATGLITMFTSSMGKSREETDKFAMSVNRFSNEIDAAKSRMSSLQSEMEFMQKLNTINLKIGFADTFQQSNIAASGASVSKMQEIQSLIVEEKKAYALFEQASSEFTAKASKNAINLASKFSSFSDIGDDLLESLNKSDRSLISSAKKTSDFLIDTQKKLDTARKDSVVLQRGLTSIRVEEDRRLAKEAAEAAEAERKRLANLPTIAKTIAELGREISFLNAKGIALGEDQVKPKMAAIFSTIEKLIKDFNVGPDDTIIRKLLGTDLNNLFGSELTNFETNIKSLQLRIGQNLDGVTVRSADGKTPTIKIPVKFELTPEQEAGAKKALKPFLGDLTDEANAIGEQMAESMASGFGDTLGRALAGAASVGDLFSGIFQQLGSSLSALGDIFIQAGITVALFKRILLDKPGLAIAAGIALKVLGAFVKAKTTRKVPGFADGVTNFSGGLAVVGERGPELVRLPSGSDVIPNHELGGLSIGGGQNIAVIVTGQLRNDHIFISNKNAQAQRGRQT